MYLASSYRQAGRANDATTTGEQVATDHIRILGPDHPNTLNTKANLAASYAPAGRTNDAITLLGDVLAVADDVFGPDHPELLAMRADYEE